MIAFSVSDFKKKCLSIFSNIGKSRETILITKYGKPVAKIIPVEEEEYENPLEGSVLFEGDVISPIDEQWDSNK